MVTISFECPLTGCNPLLVLAQITVGTILAWYVLNVLAHTFFGFTMPSRHTRD